MNLLKTLKIKVPHGEVGVDVYALSGGDREANALKPKRVYTIAYNMRQEVVTIYNDKQHFWGFPGGHIEKGETVCEAALREFDEEAHLTLMSCKAKYILAIGPENEKECEVVCFAKTTTNDLHVLKSDDDEIGDIAFSGREETLKKLGNRALWELML